MSNKLLKYVKEDLDRSTLQTQSRFDTLFFMAFSRNKLIKSSLEEQLIMGAQIQNYIDYLVEDLINECERLKTFFRRLDMSTAIIDQIEEIIRYGGELNTYAIRYTHETVEEVTNGGVITPPEEYSNEDGTVDEDAVSAIVDVITATILDTPIPPGKAVVAVALNKILDEVIKEEEKHPEPTKVESNSTPTSNSANKTPSVAEIMATIDANREDEEEREAAKEDYESKINDIVSSIKSLEKSGLEILEDAVFGSGEGEAAGLVATSATSGRLSNPALVNGVKAMGQGLTKRAATQTARGVAGGLMAQLVEAGIIVVGDLADNATRETVAKALEDAVETIKNDLDNGKSATEAFWDAVDTLRSQYGVALDHVLGGYDLEGNPTEELINNREGLYDALANLAQSAAESAENNSTPDNPSPGGGDPDCNSDDCDCDCDCDCDDEPPAGCPSTSDVY